MGTRVNGVDLSAGLSNPMTTAGDLITGGASGTPTRLAVGAEGERLTVVGGVPAWAATPAGGIDTSLQAAPDTGWTAAGDGSAAISGGVATVTVTPAQVSGVLRRAQVVCSPFLPAIEVIARVTVTTVPAAGAYYAGIGVINADIPANASTVRGLLAQADSAGAMAGLYTDSAGSWVSHGTAALPAALTSGTLWLRLVYSAGGVSAFAGSGATIPSTWTQLAAAAPVHAISGTGTVTQIVVYAGRVGGGSGTYVVQWSDIQWRSLLGAPA